MTGSKLDEQKADAKMPTSQFGDAGNIFFRDHLGVLQTRPQGSDVDSLQNRFEDLQNGTIGPITNCMDILSVIFVSNGTPS